MVSKTLYNILYNLWKNENKDGIQHLSHDAYTEIKLYLNNLRNEFESLDRKSLKSQMKLQEINNAKYLVKDLILRRYHKLIALLYNKKIDKFQLTREEKSIYDNLQNVSNQIENLIESVISARAHSKIIIRFLQEAPAIVGSDIKIYGPFMVEDLASLPIKNVESLIKRGVVKQVDLH